MSLLELVCSLAIAAHQSPPELLKLVGLTHASSVIPVVRSSDGASLTTTVELVPLNLRASPYLPAVVQVALERVPVLPLPEPSAVVVPLPSLKAYDATRLLVLLTVTVSEAAA